MRPEKSPMPGAAESPMAPIKRFVCIHGHFYQPPRENPWLETVETQDSAAPYHDWNERICAECYATNGAARIVNIKNHIIRIVNNYSRISFNFGPTLLSWLKENAPRTYRMILDGESHSRESFKGHSSAMAQNYNHVIMPLANRRDKITQIRWGIADYEFHYGVPPEGMWLAETAVDSETLELLADHGIKFTVLAPHQCKCIRPLSDGALWTDTPDAAVDTSRPYLVQFDSGVSMAVFFYDGPRSRAIAFEGLLNSGENFAARLKAGFRDTAHPQMVHVATDGESYGHYHKHGEMALAYALRLLEDDKNVRLTNYGSYLAQFPPEFECRIEDNTSWSCAHGIERWRSNCGCNGGKSGWNQLWRAPLRQALDELRDALIPLTDRAGRELFHDVWAARDAYIRVVLDRSEESIEEFLLEQRSHPHSSADRMRALKLMEMQRHAQLMYTSCAWFFDDISGIETVQIIAYAARVLQLAASLFGADAAGLESAFLARIAEAKSNSPRAGDGARIYREKVIPLKLGLEQVAAHYAIASMFSSFAEETELFIAEASGHVMRADFPEVIRLLDRFYGHVDYSLTSLFTDEQRRIVKMILNSTLWDIEKSLTSIYDDHASLLHYLSQAGLPKPPALTLAAGFAINAGLRRALEGDPIDEALLRSFLKLAKADQVQLETATLSYIADQRMKRAMIELQMSGGSLEMLDRALTLARTLSELPFELNLWQAQNIWYEILRSSGDSLTAHGPEDRSLWDRDFAELGEHLLIDTASIRTPDASIAAPAD